MFTKFIGGLGAVMLGLSSVSSPITEIIEKKEYLLGGSEPQHISIKENADVFSLLKSKQELLYPNSNTNQIYVATSEELRSALSNAQAGDEIILTAEIYSDDITGTKGSSYSSSAEGDMDKPITIRSINPEKPAILKGKAVADGVVLYITGDYWKIEDLKVENAQKGIILDNSNYSIIDNCEVYNTGAEGVHFRDNSSYCIIQYSYIHHTGLVSPQYGEGVYVGSAKSTTGYGKACDYNTIKTCTFDNVAAEHVDIKEETTGTIVENCLMNGIGMTGQNYADSFVDVQGNSSIIRNNTCYRNENPFITDAFQVHVQIEGWGERNRFYGNTAYLDDETSACLIESWASTSYISNNTRIPSSTGDYMYAGYFEEFDID